MPTYLARYHSDIGNINNYDFIFRVTDNIIEKVLYLSQTLQLCNNDTIYNVTHGDTLEGLKIASMNLNNRDDGDQPDVFIIEDREHPLVLHQSHRRSMTTFITKDVLQQLIKYIVKHDPLLAEVLA